MSVDFLGVAPWAVVSASVTWASMAYAYREKRRVERVKHSDRLEIHRDELTFDLLQNARTEIGAVRAEVEDLRQEISTLRELEKHFYHFQQSLDHLEAIMFAQTSEDRAAAERNARAFLTRMRRLNEAKGTLRNEVQRTASVVSVAEQAVKKPTDNKEVPK